MIIENKIIQQQIDETLTLLQNVLEENLLGVYLYGSLLMGGLQKYSDIDLFAVVTRETTRREKEQLENELLKISGIYAVSKELKPIELTIVVQSMVNPWQYPPSFDFLYGDWLRKEFEAGNVEPWPTKQITNLAIVITQILLSHKTLYGSHPDQLLAPVPYHDFITASTSEVDSLLSDFDWDTRNVLLTLARIWSTLETDTIKSKADAVDWVLEKLSAYHRPVLLRAKAILLGQEEDQWGDIPELAKQSAQFMIEEIKKQMELIMKTDSDQRIISC